MASNGRTNIQSAGREMLRSEDGNKAAQYKARHQDVMLLYMKEITLSDNAKSSRYTKYFQSLAFKIEGSITDEDVSRMLYEAYDKTEKELNELELIREGYQVHLITYNICDSGNYGQPESSEAQALDALMSIFQK